MKESSVLTDSVKSHLMTCGGYYSITYRAHGEGDLHDGGRVTELQPMGSKQACALAHSESSEVPQLEASRSRSQTKNPDTHHRMYTHRQRDEMLIYTMWHMRPPDQDQKKKKKALLGT